MNGNSEGSIERTADDEAESRRMSESYELERTNWLIIISRYHLLIDKEGPPFTHVCGISVEDIKKRIERYASGINMGSNLLYKYPWV